MRITHSLRNLQQLLLLLAFGVVMICFIILWAQGRSTRYGTIAQALASSEVQSAFLNRLSSAGVVRSTVQLGQEDSLFLQRLIKKDIPHYKGGRTFVKQLYKLSFHTDNGEYYFLIRVFGTETNRVYVSAVNITQKTKNSAIIVPTEYYLLGDYAGWFQKFGASEVNSQPSTNKTDLEGESD